MLKDKNKTENEWQYLKCHFNHDQIIYSEEKPVQVVCLQKCSEQSFQENFFVLLFRMRCGVLKSYKILFYSTHIHILILMHDSFISRSNAFSFCEDLRYVFMSI